MNIFSVYCHLSENKVTTKDKIKKGQIIGLTGATGRVSGPHLHLGIKYDNGNIDFEELQKKSEIVF
jgi:murein DD-endopeptidase MepM/ murein hydrolase activator NlpD